MATLYSRSGKYYVNFAINGKRMRQFVGSDLKEAQLRLLELEFKLSKGVIKANKPDIPLIEFFDQFLKDCKTRLSTSTTTRYKNAITHFLTFYTTHYPILYISQITRGSIQDYIAFRQRDKPKNKTINVELTVLRAALNR